MYYQVISYLIYHFKAARKLIAIIPKNKSSQKLGLWIHTVFQFRVILRNWLILFSYKLKEDGWSQRCVGNCCICTLLSKIARNAGGSSVTYRSSPLVFFFRSRLNWNVCPLSRLRLCGGIFSGIRTVFSMTSWD